MGLFATPASLSRRGNPFFDTLHMKALLREGWWQSARRVQSSIQKVRPMTNEASQRDAPVLDSRVAGGYDVDAGDTPGRCDQGAHARLAQPTGERLGGGDGR